MLLSNPIQIAAIATIAGLPRPCSLFKLSNSNSRANLKMASCEEGCDLPAPSELPSEASGMASSQLVSGNLTTPKHCTACGTLVKEHLGPHGKGRCVVGTLTALQERVEKLEATIAQNEAHHKRELADQAALFATRVEGLVTLIESLPISDRSGSETACRPLMARDAEGSSVDVASLGGSNSADASLPLPGCATPRAAVDTPLSSSLPVKSSSCLPESGEERKGCKASDAPKRPIERPLKSCGEGANDNLLAPIQGGECASGCTDARALAHTRSDSNESMQLTTTKWTEVVRKRRSASPSKTTRGNIASGLRTRSGNGRTASIGYIREGGCSDLSGAQPVKTKCFFVSGIDQKCSAEQIRKYCLERGVRTTGCYLLRSRIWGTQSAKLFVSDECCDKMDTSGFWPQYVSHREWRYSPPEWKADAPAPRRSRLTSEVIAVDTRKEKMGPLSEGDRCEVSPHTAAGLGSENLAQSTSPQ